MKKTHLGALVAVTAAFLSITTVTRADIIFGPAQNISDVFDVLATGTTHAAVNAAENSQTDVTLNGVIFESGNVNDATNIITSGFTQTNAADLNPNLLAGPDPANAEYNRFLGDVDFNVSGTIEEITIENLTVGNAYAVQVWFVDDRTGNNGNRITTIAGVDAGGNSVGSVALNDQFAIGTFTADQLTEVFTASTNGGAAPNITGFQVRDLGVAVPEPSSLAVLGLMGLGLTTARRRK